MSDADGRRVDTVAFGEAMRVHVSFEALTHIQAPGVALWIANQDRVRVFTAGARENGEALADLSAGERIEFSIETENRLSSGRYFIGCTMVRGSAGLDVLIYTDRAAEIVSYGAELHGLIGVDYVSHVSRARAQEPVR
jgi:hypothetical protein